MLRVSMTIKLSRERLEAFRKQHYNLIDIFETGTEHDKLLREHIIDMYLRLDQMLGKQQQNYSLKLTNAEAMAFYQVWQQVDLRHCPFSRLIVDDAIEKIDKFHKSPQNKYRYEQTGI